MPTTGAHFFLELIFSLTLVSNSPRVLANPCRKDFSSHNCVRRSARGIFPFVMFAVVCTNCACIVCCVKKGRFNAFSHSVPISHFVPSFSSVRLSCFPQNQCRDISIADKPEPSRVSLAQFVVARERKYRKWRANESLCPHEQA